MAYDIEAVNRAVRSYVADVNAVFPIEKAYLYGSYAKGNPAEFSDIDICFFLPSFGSQRSVDIVADLLTIAGRYAEYDIEPRVFQASEIERGNPFVREILKTGREIHPET